MKTHVFALLLILCVFNTAAQETESLEEVINQILIKETDQLRHGEKYKVTDSADSLAIEQLLKEASKYSNSPTDSFYILSLNALEISVHVRSLRYISLSMENLGDFFVEIENYVKATSFYLTSLRIEELRGDQVRIATLNDAMGSVCYFLELFDKSFTYHNKALAIYEQFKDTLNIAHVLRHLGSLHSSREFCEKRTTNEKHNDFNLAIQYFKRAMALYKIKRDTDGIAGCQVNIGAVYNKLDQPGIAKGYIEKALAYYRHTRNWKRVGNTLYSLGRTYYKAGEYDKSVNAFEESRKILEGSGYREGIQFLYESMAQTYHASHDYKNAYEYYIRYMILRDSVYNAEKSNQVLELETKYQSGLKENKILRLSIEKKHKNQIIWALTGIIGLMCISGYFFFRMHNKNKIIAGQLIEIKEKKILELEKDQQLIAAQSVLRGEEFERSRIAGDLHDGLGGLLSGVKISLSIMKDNATLTHDNVSAFNQTISLLDTSISELRRIAHNLMPEALNKYGLKSALEDFCILVSPAVKVKVNFSFFGEEIRYSKEIELTLYRIAQELVNNALKHADASLINVQLFSEPERICLQVTDNGKGFDFRTELIQDKGRGLLNIRNRTNALNGRFDCWSRKGIGTEINVEFDLN